MSWEIWEKKRKVSCSPWPCLLGVRISDFFSHQPLCGLCCCREECSWTFHLTTRSAEIHVCFQATPKWNFISQEHVCCELLKAEKKEKKKKRNTKDIKSSFQISSPRQAHVTHAHTWSRTLTGIKPIYLVFGRKNKIKKIVFSGHLAIIPSPTVALGAGNHGELSGKVSRNVCSERTQRPSEEQGAALQASPLTHSTLTDTRRVSQQVSTSVKSVSVEAESLNKIT